MKATFGAALRLLAAPTRMRLTGLWFTRARAPDSLSIFTLENGTTNLSGDPIAIEDAIVVAVGYFNVNAENPGELWLQNASGVIRTFGIDPGVVVAVGDRVSFDVTELSDYQGVLQITGVTNFTVDASEQQVFILEWNDIAPENRERNAVYHVYGEVTVGDVACGGTYECFTVSTEQGDIFLRGNPEIALGDCVEFVGPLGGLQADDQLNATNYSWARTY